MKFKSLLLPLMLPLVSSCSGTYSSNKSDEFNIPQKNEVISIYYLNSMDNKISITATEVLETQLVKCSNISILKSSKVEEILIKNKIIVPKRISEEFVKSIAPIIGSKYIIFGDVLTWREGDQSYPAQTTQVSLSITMYELSTGKIVWTSSGLEDFSAFLDPIDKAPQVIVGMFSKWNGFCQ